MLIFVECVSFILAIIGQFLIVKKNATAFVAWIISDVLWAVLALLRKDYLQTVMFVAYVVSQVWGLWKWTKENQ